MLTFVCVSAVIYAVTALLVRKVDRDTTSSAICLFLPIIVTIIMITSSKTPSMRNVGEAAGLFALLVFMLASIPTLISITSLRDLIKEGKSAKNSIIALRVIGLLVCFPLSVFINQKIGSRLWYYMHYMTIITYILLAVTAAGGVYLLVKKHNHNKDILY